MQAAPRPEQSFKDLFDALAAQLERVLRGKRRAVHLALVCLFSEGHLLIEDVPGVGKTSLAKAIARSIGGSWRRVQFTPDLLPSDVTGVSVWDRARGDFEFRPGGVFANVVLADEINRASPKTQSALLEAMEEHQVTVDGTTHRLPDPFFLVATENPFGTAGTFPLPESQLDRFAMVCTIGRPNRDAEREILGGTGGTDALQTITPVTTPAELVETMHAVRKVHCANSVLDYVLDVADATRNHPGVALGASPRASLSMLHAAQAHATVTGRDFVSPDDVKAVAAASLAHRIVLADGVDISAGARVVADIVGAVTAPRP